MMNGMKWSGLGLLVLAWPGLSWSQEPSFGDPMQDPVPKAEAPSGAEIKKLVNQLGAASYRDRRAAESKLEALGEPALDMLRRAAADHADPEVQWRAERLVQRITGEEAGAGPGEKTGEKTGGGLRPRDGAAPPPAEGDGEPVELFDTTQDFLDRVLRDMESGFPADDPEWAERIRERMRRQMEDMRRAMGAFPDVGGRPGAGGLFDGRGLLDGIAQRSGKSVQVGPDGVRVEVQETNDEGEVETKVYEADDLESFRTKYPGVLDDGIAGPRGLRPIELPLGPGGIRIDDRFGPGLLFEDAPRGSLPSAAPPPERRRLGVSVGDLHPAVREYLGGGMLVAQVQDGTLAERLGIEDGDVVLEIAGQRIRSVPDVGEALGGIDPGEVVEVVVNRRGHMKTLTADKGPDEAAGERADEKGPEAPRGLKPRKPGK